ncbi:hypothetical protein TRVA0_001S07778 [Trichomonascus vanleenenianus]|uniref:homeobox domain-containing protein n=1 Tax=Trichomonascus vanleenenianus TaxID=2268995 RepID=UPI003ECB6E45
MSDRPDNEFEDYSKDDVQPVNVAHRASITHQESIALIRTTTRHIVSMLRSSYLALASDTSYRDLSGVYDIWHNQVDAALHRAHMLSNPYSKSKNELKKEYSIARFQIQREIMMLRYPIVMAARSAYLRTNANTRLRNIHHRRHRHPRTHDRKEEVFSNYKRIEGQVRQEEGETKQLQTKILTEWYIVRGKYLKEGDAETLSHRTKLSIPQVKQWFTNKRRRERK